MTLQYYNEDATGIKTPTPSPPPRLSHYIHQHKDNKFVNITKKLSRHQNNHHASATITSHQHKPPHCPTTSTNITGGLPPEAACLNRHRQNNAKDTSTQKQAVRRGHLHASSSATITTRVANTAISTQAIKQPRYWESQLTKTQHPSTPPSHRQEKYHTAKRG
jgi:hypothetical protein